MIVYAIIGTVFFFAFTSFWGFLSAIRPPKITSDITPKDYSLEFERVEFQTRDNVTLRGWYIPATGGETGKTIIGLHGYPADKGNILPVLRSFANEYNLLLFDFRYFGESDGAYSTAGAKEVEDLRAAVAFAKRRGAERIGVWGFSMGGAVALMGQREMQDINAVVSHSAYANLADLGEELYRLPLLDTTLAKLTFLWARVIVGVNAYEVSPAQAVQGSDIPVFVSHSRQDDVIDFSHAEALREALSGNERFTFYVMEDALHGVLSDEYLNAVREFFREQL